MKPTPPSTWVADRVASIAASVANSFAVAASVLNGLPWSRSQAAWYARCRAAASATLMSAQRKATAWLDPIGRPNVVPLAGVSDRVVDTASEHPDAERGDGDPPVVEDLEELGDPAPALAEQMVLGHSALDERQSVRVGSVPAHLAVRRLHLQPVVPAGTRIVEISPGPVSAVTVTTDVIGVPELVMNAFAPSITHSPLDVVRARPGAGTSCVAAGVRLGEAERTERATGAQVGQPALLLFGASRRLGSGWRPGPRRPRR